MINHVLYGAREVSKNGQRNKVYAATANIIYYVYITEAYSKSHIHTSLFLFCTFFLYILHLFCKFYTFLVKLTEKRVKFTENFTEKYGSVLGPHKHFTFFLFAYFFL